MNQHQRPHQAHDLRPYARSSGEKLRVWKQRAHEAFDPLWRTGPLTRNEAYAWMARAMGLPRRRAHIGMFSMRQCRKLIRILRREAVAS